MQWFSPAAFDVMAAMPKTLPVAIAAAPTPAVAIPRTRCVLPSCCVSPLGGGGGGGGGRSGSSGPTSSEIDAPGGTSIAFVHGFAPGAVARISW
jgi:hypothetical protein